MTKCREFPRLAFGSKQQRARLTSACRQVSRLKEAQQVQLNEFSKSLITESRGAGRALP